MYNGEYADREDGCPHAVRLGGRRSARLLVSVRHCLEVLPRHPSVTVKVKADRDRTGLPLPESAELRHLAISGRGQLIRSG